MIAPVDWAELAEKLGVFAPSGGETLTGETGYQALEILIGEPAIRAAVDHCVALAPGWLLAESVLRIARPWAAMTYCHEIWSGLEPIERRRQAVRVLQWIADERALKWVAGFLDDPDEDIQCWGAGMLDQLLWCNFVSSQDCEDLLGRLESHQLAEVRDRAKFIRGYLADRQEWQRIRQASDVARDCAERS